MSEPRDLVLLSDAQRALTQARSVDEVCHLRDRAAAVRAYARKAKLGQDILFDAATIKLRAERRLGEILQQTELAKGSPGNQHTQALATSSDNSLPVTLKELGLTKSESSRSQRIAELPEEAFEQYLAESIAAKREPTMTAILKLIGKKGSPSQSSAKSHTSGSPVSASEASSRRYATGLMNLNGLLSSEYRDLGSLLRESASSLFLESAQLHVWCLPEQLLDALDLVEAWDFAYASAIPVATDDADGSNFWPVTHGLLVLGTRGTTVFSGISRSKVLDKASPANADLQMRISVLVQQVSPAPYVYLYPQTARTPRDWDCWPNSPVALKKDAS